MVNFFYLGKILSSRIRRKKKTKQNKMLDVCCKTLSGIPQANPPLLLSRIFEAHSIAFGVVVVCVLQL